MSDINFCNTKEQLNHLGEVVTGKVNGSPAGADIDTSTLPYTGQVRKTLPALEDEYQADIDNFVQVSGQVIVDKTDEFDASIANKESEADSAIDAYRLLSKGPYAAGILLEDKFQYITYSGESYFATNPPYTTTSTTPDADVNLFVGGYVNESLATQIAESVLEENISTYTDIAYKASGGNSAVENMIAGVPISASVGNIVSTGGTTWKVTGDPSTIDGFTPINDVWVKDFGAVGGGFNDDTTKIQEFVTLCIQKYYPMRFQPDVYLVTASIIAPQGPGVIDAWKSIDGTGAVISCNTPGVTIFDYTPGAGLLAAQYNIIWKGFKFISNDKENNIKAFNTSKFVSSTYVDMFFEKIAYPFYNDILDTQQYVQGAIVERCHSFHHKQFFTAYKAYHTSIINNLIDATSSGIGYGIIIDVNDGSGQSGFGIRINRNQIQSQGNVGLKLGGINGLEVNGNYWENNTRDFETNHPTTISFYGASIQNNFTQPKDDTYAWLTLGASQADGVQFGGNVTQSGELYDFEGSSSQTGYFDITEDRNTGFDMYDINGRKNTNVIFNDRYRWGLSFSSLGGIVLNPNSRGIEFSNDQWDYDDLTNNVKVPIVDGWASILSADGNAYPPSDFLGIYNQKVWARGSQLKNPTPAELGAAGSKYIVNGWVCMTSGEPGAWDEMRSLTGN